MQKPFAELMSAVKKALRKQRQEDRREQATAARQEHSPRATVGGSNEALTRAEEAARAAEPDEVRFMREMQGVRPLARGNFVAAQHRVKPAPRRDEDNEALAELADLVEGRAYFDITNSDEFIEGIAHGLDRRLLRRLKRGYFSVQAHIDLHGRTRQEAREVLPGFIAKSRKRGRRCVLIVHGRGLNSKDQIPVLKESLKVWLTRGSMSRAVLAFCTARPSDGGAGAVYVLLRK
jgi:DNA-nicking Smr family endonuclease